MLVRARFFRNQVCVSRTDSKETYFTRPFFFLLRPPEKPAPGPCDYTASCPTDLATACSSSAASASAIQAAFRNHRRRSRGLFAAERKHAGARFLQKLHITLQQILIYSFLHSLDITLFSTDPRVPCPPFWHTQASMFSFELQHTNDIFFFLQASTSQQ